MNRATPETDLGVSMRDLVSGFEGIATGRCTYLNGCHQYLISPPVDKDGKKIDGEWIDFQQLEVVDLGVADRIPGPAQAVPDAPNPPDARSATGATRPGGPRDDAPPVR